jgi:hypothetical protein
MRGAVSILCLVWAWCCGEAARGQSPAAELARAVADCEQLPAVERSGSRYLSLYALAREDRPRAIAVVSFVLNSVSRSRLLVRPRVVDATLLRFSLANYTTNEAERHAWFDAWEELAKVDPYWHLQTEVAIAADSGPRLVAGGGKPAQIRAPAPLQSAAAIRTVTTDGGWVGLQNAARLKALTGSQGALLRGEWFVEKTAQPPAYYQFAGIPSTQAAWLKSLGIDAAAIDRLRANLGANLVQSNVTSKPRRVIWQASPLGSVYATLDVERVTADRDFLRRPLSAAGLQANFDASEWFALSPNGLWWTALFDKNGQRQDAVPDRIAKDTSDPQADGRVVPMISCLRCHTESGLKSFRDDQSTLLGSGVSLFSADPSLTQRVAEFYQADRLQRQLKFDRETYAAAVRECTGGQTAEELAAALAKVVRDEAYRSVTPDQAAREVGVATESFVRALRATHDPILLLLLARRPVLRGQWESSFAEAALENTP